PLDGTINDRTDTDLMTFNVSTDEEVSKVATANGGAPNTNPARRPLPGDGTQVRGLTGFGLFDDGPLTVSGTPYRVEIVDSGQNDTGTYLFPLQRLPPSAALFPYTTLFRSPLDGTINDRTDTDLMTFNVSTDEEVS